MKARAAIVMPSAADGHSRMSGWVSMVRNPSFIIWPQLASDAVPMPRNCRPVCMPMGMPAVRADWMITGACTARSTWVWRILTWVSPATRTASM